MLRDSATDAVKKGHPNGAPVVAAFKARSLYSPGL